MKDFSKLFLLLFKLSASFTSFSSSFSLFFLKFEWTILISSGLGYNIDLLSNYFLL